MMKCSWLYEYNDDYRIRSQIGVKHRQQRPHLVGGS